MHAPVTENVDDVVCHVAGNRDVDHAASVAAFVADTVAAMELATPTHAIVQQWYADWRQRPGFMPQVQSGVVPGMTALALSLSGSEVGVVAIGVGESANILDLWLAPEQRGHGYAHRALAVSEEWCRHQGARTARAAIHERDPAATAVFSDYIPVAQHMVANVTRQTPKPHGTTWRTMRRSEFPEWRTRCADEYAQQSATAYGTSPTSIRPVALRTIDTAFSDGSPTPGNELWVLEVGNARVASLWIRIDSDPAQVYIQNVETSPQHRRNGYGRAAIRWAQNRAYVHGLPHVRLNVFAHNHAALQLYHTMGYETTTEFRIKHLPA